MNTEQLICISVRLLFVLLAKNFNKTNLRQAGYAALIPAIGFLCLFLTKAQTFQNVWWDNLRPIHSILYFVFSYLAVNGNNKAYLVLLTDVSIGLTMFLLKNDGHFRNSI